MTKNSAHSTDSFVLSCGCTKVYSDSPPKLKEMVTCRFHGNATVLHVAPQWEVKCEKPGCLFKKKCGTSGRLLAERTAVGHRRLKANRSHSVVVYSPTGKIHRRFDGDNGVIALPFDSSPPY